MRLLTIAGMATLLLLPAGVAANACGAAAQHQAQAPVQTQDQAQLQTQAQAPAAAADLSAAAKKPMHKAAKKPKEKVEYMRSAAGPEPTVKKPKKAKKTKM